MMYLSCVTNRAHKSSSILPISHLSFTFTRTHQETFIRQRLMSPIKTRLVGTIEILPTGMSWMSFGGFEVTYLELNRKLKTGHKGPSLCFGSQCQLSVCALIWHCHISSKRFIFEPFLRTVMNKVWAFLFFKCFIF